MDIFFRRGSTRSSGRRPASAAAIATTRGSTIGPEFRPKIREVHRCGWLSVLKSPDHHEAGAFAIATGSQDKTREKRWVVFCIHDDEYPFVELYVDEKKAVNHQPESYFLVRPCFHVSPCIMPLDEGELRYYFVIALWNEVLELGAMDRMAMMEWVECLRRKLRELKILAPRMNIYSAEPLPRTPLPSSRNPLSPLPPCPNGNMEVPLGVELAQDGDRSSLRGQAAASLAPAEQSTPGVESQSGEDEDVYVPVWGANSAAAATPVSSASFVPFSTQSDQTVTNSSGQLLGAYANTELLDLNRASTDATADFPLVPVPPPPCVVEQLTYERAFDVSDVTNRTRHSSDSSASTSTYETTFDTDRRVTRRRSSGISPSPGPGDGRVGATPPSVPSRSIVNRPLPAPPVLPPRPPQKTMKEEQVEDFRRQQRAMNLKTRVPYRDCVGTLALVDCFGAVWIAGWKQKEHPRLNYYFHIGDQLRAINGTKIVSSSQAQKLVKDNPTPEVELLFKRVPLGKIVLIKRSLPGESLGIVRLGNAGVIQEVIEDGLAHACGLPLKATTVDGFSLTNWTLTEVNGRSLNLFFKGNEVADRLNAVGQEISLLVQPQELVDAMKRQLKQMRSYKDYIVQ